MEEMNLKFKHLNRSPSASIRYQFPNRVVQIHATVIDAVVINIKTTHYGYDGRPRVEVQTVNLHVKLTNEGKMVFFGKLQCDISGNRSEMPIVPQTSTVLVANSTPMVVFDSRLKEFRANRESSIVPQTSTVLVANSTPMVVFDSRLKEFRANRESSINFSRVKQFLTEEEYGVEAIADMRADHQIQDGVVGKSMKRFTTCTRTPGENMDPVGIIVRMQIDDNMRPVDPRICRIAHESNVRGIGFYSRIPLNHRLRQTIKRTEKKRLQLICDPNETIVTDLFN
ncbi:hypothetical protein NECAME_16548 [Necator americanus]|uniref:Uncharacterized protein n=1 Tax=Necator americanus TaxID=51031 RepID=W2TY88_NECAM|nr:hypothetical protein NECAME_16548 [Necator americanus]ETN85987.1 hypothetical protein NECAME_16548 [Necator americanus]